MRSPASSRPPSNCSTRAVKPAESPAEPQNEIRTVALGLFDAIDEHPWLATQLSHSPRGPVTPRILESIGRQVRALGVPEGSWFTATSALMHYILGAAGQNAANARTPAFPAWTAASSSTASPRSTHPLVVTTTS
jgi:hypothetical protein